MTSSPIFPCYGPILAPVSRSYDRVDGLLAQWGEQRPELDVAPLQVVARIARVSAHLDRAVEAMLSTLDLKWWEVDVLGALRRAGPPFRLSPGELSERLMVTSGTMTTRVDRLEDRGFVAREQAAHDRRGVVVSLTDAGRSAIDDAMQPHLANLERILEPLSDESQAVIADALRAWLIALEGHAPDDLPRPK